VVRGATALMRRRAAADTAVRCARRVHWGVRHFVPGRRNTKRLMAGGRVVAVVGGDGAGKSTLVGGLTDWLHGPLDTRVLHMGKPPRSPATVAVKGAVTVGRRLHLLDHWLPHYPTAEEHHGQPPSTPWLAWQYVTAADRWRQHRRVRALAARGYVVVCDRFPLEQITQMDGSRTRWVPRAALPRLGRYLVDREQACYAAMSEPDLLLVLRLDPATAVARKEGVDPAAFVRRRSAEVFGIDWHGSRAVLLDAARPAADVLADARAAVWANL
jgi:thymidylate kinase